MRLVIDAVGVRSGSAAIVIGNLLAGWTSERPADRITVLVDREPDYPLPDQVAVERIGPRSGSLLARLWAQSVEVRRACRRLDADALLSAVTASAFLGARCPRGVIVYDLRHELRPAQFSTQRRLVRKLLYGWSFRRADALICISERTRTDLVARRPYLEGKAFAALLGADHTDGWQAVRSKAPAYALAFGQFANKNVDRVLRAWQGYPAGRSDVILRICGLGGAARKDAEKLTSELGIAHQVELLPWLTDEQFQTVFAGAAAILFPSDFEGFGLPAVEALRLGIPVVVSADPALIEVSGGHAVVAGDDSVETLVAAIERAMNLGECQVAAGVEHAKQFTWAGTARVVHDILVLSGARP